MKVKISKISSDFKVIVTGLFEGNETISDCGILGEKQVIDNIKQLSNFDGSFGDFFFSPLYQKEKVL